MPFVSLPSPPTIFPTYLVPSLPFRRRKSSTDSNTSTTSTASSSSASTPEDDSYLTSHTSHLRCSRCLSDLALSSQIISKGFTGRHGRAYLVAPASAPSSSLPLTRRDTLPNLPNTYTHKPVPRQLVTGAHTVGDISCSQCGSVLGWKYVSAENEDQKYKVGKFILETKRVCRSSTWEEGAVKPTLLPKDISEEIAFDSQDEDECDALFAGQWTPQYAKSVRREKRSLNREFGRVPEE